MTDPLAFLSPAARAALEQLVDERLEERLRGLQAGTPYMTVAEAADYLRWPRKRLYTLTAGRAIPHRKHEGRLLFRRDELDRWLDDHHEGPHVAR